jgi:hypothetical protein
VSRFLIKILQIPGHVLSTGEDHVDYVWLYLSFCSLWLEDLQGKHSHVVVCFDDCEKIIEHIKKACSDYASDGLIAHPLAMQNVFVRVLVNQYDKAVWRFRKPVRTLEKVSFQTTPSIW